MNIIIMFDELSRYINKHYGKTLIFEKVSEKEVSVVIRSKDYLQNGSDSNQYHN